MKTPRNDGAVSTLVFGVVVVIVLILAAAGGYFAGMAVGPSQTQKTVTNTMTSTITNSGSQGVVTTTVTSTASPSLPAASSTSFTIGVSHFTTPPTAPTAYINQNNLTLMKEYVPNAKMEQFASGSTGILQAMASGTVQMGVAITDSVLAAIAQGVPVTIVASWESSPVEQAVFVSSNSSITSISQLKGATLAVTGPTSLSATVAKIMAAQQGWGSSYSLSSVGSVPACVAAVESGSATASLLDPFESIFSSPSLRVIGLVNETWPEFSVVATNAFIAAHPDAVRATLAMLGYANNFFNTNPAGQAEQFMATYPLYNMTTTQYNYFMALSHWSSDGTIHSLEYQAAINELYAYKVISTNLTASSVYSGEFVSVVP